VQLPEPYAYHYYYYWELWWLCIIHVALAQYRTLPHLCSAQRVPEVSLLNHALCGKVFKGVQLFSGTMPSSRKLRAYRSSFPPVNGAAAIHGINMHWLCACGIAPPGDLNKSTRYCTSASAVLCLERIQTRSSTLEHRYAGSLDTAVGRVSTCQRHYTTLSRESGQALQIQNLAFASRND
jgi:hypothetical protein